jgi:transposase
VSFIQANVDKYTIRQMCKALKFSRSTYYSAINHKTSKREEEYKQFVCSVKRVQRHMKELNIKSIVVKKYQYNKNQGKVPDGKGNILNRNFEADTIYKKLVTDITYIHVAKEGWTYLASVMDLYDRKIIGWSYGRNITVELATQAVKNVCLNIPGTKGIIVHSDLGSQYTIDEFESYLRAKGMQHYFSRKGNPYDNACIESFHSVLKKEEVYTTTYHTFE